MEAAKNRFVKMDGSGDVLPGKWHVRHSLSGQELAALSLRTELGHKLFKFSEASPLSGRDSDRYTLAITEEVISFYVHLCTKYIGTTCIGKQ